MSTSRQYLNAKVTAPAWQPLRILRALVGVVFSFEFIFVVFLFAGVIKRNPKLAWIPLDLTAASFGLSLLAGFFWLHGRRWKISGNTAAILVAFLLFFGWILVSLAWSHSWTYGVPKAVHLFLMGSWAVFACTVIIGPDKKRLKKFCISLVVLALFLAGEVVARLAAGTLLEEWDFASNYLGLGRLLGLSTLVLVGVLLWGNVGFGKGLAVGILVGFLLSILMISGGRGPLLATLAALIVAPVCDARFSYQGFYVRRKFLFFAGFLLLLLVGFVTIGNRFFLLTTIDRLMVLLEGGGGGSAQFRVWFFANAWDFWWEAPLFGHGVGEFGTLLEWGDVRVYPHNIFLEVMVEFGLVGLGLLILSVYLSLRNFSLRLLRADYYLAMTFMFVLCAFFNAQVSGDLPDNRVLFALLGLFAGRLDRVGRLDHELSA